MPKIVKNQLTAAKLTKLPPGKHIDGGGLMLVVAPGGTSRRWVWRGTISGRGDTRREYGLGSASVLSLGEARKKAAEYHALARTGLCPTEEDARRRGLTLLFEEAAERVWHDTTVPSASNGKHVAQWITTLRTYANPVIGKKPLGHVTRADVVAILRPIWVDKAETARRVKQRLSAVFEAARVEGWYEGLNPVEGVERALARQRDRVEHHAAIPVDAAPAAYARVAAAAGVGALALRFAILTAARSGEVRGARWAEIDTEAAEWRVPAGRMKAGREHVVPLSDAAMGILDLVPHGRDDDLVFNGARWGTPLSDMTMIAVMRRLKLAAVPHGWRSTFRDWAEERTSYPHAAKEAALAHTVRGVEGAYRRTTLIDARREMMRDWAGFLLAADTTIETR
ncbi:MAG: integrase arm-type DNA-binding domain-containing protein [Pseudomonadota bacterium]